MEFEIGQECSRKKSKVVWTITAVNKDNVVLEKDKAKDKKSTRTVSMKLFTNRWIIN